jgi:hypothetical protein
LLNQCAPNALVLICGQEVEYPFRGVRTALFCLNAYPG